MGKIHPLEASILIILRPIVAVGCFLDGLSKLITGLLLILGGVVGAYNWYRVVGFLVTGTLMIAAGYLLVRVPMVLDIDQRE
jgi:hypothetical protein